MKNRPIRALLLAAGLGARLKPLTNEWPKCLMPIGRRPLLEYWLQTIKSVGINDVIVNTHFHAEKVKKFIERKQFEGWVRAEHESQLLGTAGTLRAHSDFFLGHTILLVHADNWCQCDFSDFITYHFLYRPKNCLITMMTFETDTPKECGIVLVNEQNKVVSFHEKVFNPPGTRANAAVYLVQPEVLEWLKCNPQVSDFSTEVLPQFIGRIATWQNNNILRDIGTIKMLRAAQSDPHPKHHFFLNDIWQTEFEKSSVFIKVNNQL